MVTRGTSLETLKAVSPEEPCIEHKEMRTFWTLQNVFHGSHDSNVNWNIMETL